MICPLSAAMSEPIAEPAALPEAAPAATPVEGGDIVVTASRRSESISRVPTSITAVTQERMDVQGIKSISDLVRLTPGVNYLSGGLNGAPSITIRGLNAAAGAATTGVYVDDVPVHARIIAYASSSPFPIIFDLERVEVLRGPQGTLFGAGSEGGAVRFIQPKPSLTDWSGYARVEGSSIASGSNSYEAGLAVGGPLIEGKLGFRASAFYRHTGGWIDRVLGDLTVRDATASLGPKSINFVETGTWENDVNYVNQTVARMALTWAPTEDLTITPAFYYQKQYQHDIGSLFWPGISDPKNGVFKTIQFLPGVDAQHLAVPNLSLYYPGRDRWMLPSLNINWDLGPVSLTSTTGYLMRKVDQISDYNVSHAVAYGERPIPYKYDYDISDHHQRQKNLTEELRVQTTDTTSRIQAMAGLYYEKKKQRSVQGVDSNFLQLRNPYYTATAGGAPFGPGVSAFVNYYGMDAVNGTQVYYANFYAVDTQYAGFAQADWEFVDRLKLTAGVRYSRNTTSFAAIYDGPENSSTAPQGHACLPGTFLTGCVPVAIGQYAVGQGPFAPAFTNGTIKAKDSAVTPKASLEFQVTPRDMIYVSASKGFRPGAAQGIMGAGCSAELARLGFKDATGNGASPATYDRDGVWSYEAGTKDRFFGGRLRTNASAFLMKWTNIQSSVSVVSCNQSFVTNLGGATGKGFDLDASFDLTRRLTLGVQAGYAVVSFDDATKRGTATVYTKGASIPNAGPPWRVTLTGDYNLPLSSQLNAYAHADYAYTSQYRRTGNTDPGASNYDKNITPLPKAEIVNARIGVRYHSTDLSLFISNLLNSTDYLTYSRTGISYTAQTFQPRTVGVTASYRY